MTRKPSAKGGQHMDTVIPPHGDFSVHIDAPAGPHLDVGGQHVDAKAAGLHQDFKVPHADTLIRPHIDTPHHADTPGGPHVDFSFPPGSK